MKLWLIRESTCLTMWRYERKSIRAILVLKRVAQQIWCVSQEKRQGHQEDHSGLLPVKFPLSDMELPVTTINLAKSTSANKSQIRNKFLSQHYLASDWCRVFWHKDGYFPPWQQYVLQMVGCLPMDIVLSHVTSSLFTSRYHEMGPGISK